MAVRRTLRFKAGIVATNANLWLKRHLNRLSPKIYLEPINSVVEEKKLLAENLEHWIEQERQKGRQDTQRQTANNLLTLGAQTDEQIAQVTAFTLAEVKTLRSNQTH